MALAPRLEPLECVERTIHFFRLGHHPRLLGLAAPLQPIRPTFLAPHARKLALGSILERLNYLRHRGPDQGCSFDNPCAPRWNPTLARCELGRDMRSTETNTSGPALSPLKKAARLLYFMASPARLRPRCSARGERASELMALNEFALNVATVASTGDRLR